MPVALTELPASLGPRRKLWTRAECDALTSSGLLHYERLELIEGELISKMGKNRPHSNSLVLLHEWLIAVFGLRRVHQETPIDVSPEDNPTSEPEPDLIVLKSDISHFPSGNPGPADILLVIEVAESTIGFDLRTKADLYARAGILDYWVLDLTTRRMIVHRDPRDGTYTSRQAYGAEESVSPLAAPVSALRVSDAFLQ